MTDCRAGNHAYRGKALPSGVENHVAVVEGNVKFVRRLFDEDSVLKKRLSRREAVGFQDQLALEVLDLIERMTISIGAILPVWNNGSLGLGLSGDFLAGCGRPSSLDR